MNTIIETNAEARTYANEKSAKKGVKTAAEKLPADLIINDVRFDKVDGDRLRPRVHFAATPEALEAIDLTPMEGFVLVADVAFPHAEDAQPKRAAAPKRKRAPKASDHAPKSEVKKVRKGTKRKELLRALVAGATADQINAMCVKEDGTAWSKSAASAARGVFWRQLGYGTRIDGDRYFVTLPKGMTVEDCIIG